MKENQEYFDANQSLWNAKTSIHVKSDFYDMPSFMSGKTSLRKVELEELPNLSGQSLLHLQCHFGQDTLSLERMGAICTGVDISDQAILEARRIRDDLGLKSTFVQCNVLETEKHVSDMFDIVYTSYGTIIWLPDLKLWAEQIALRLKLGGMFFMAEFHPVLHLFDWAKDKIAYNYFNNGVPYMEIEEGTYADNNADIKMKEYFWQHSLSDIMTALRKEGMEITEFIEYDYSPYKLDDTFRHRADQEYVFDHGNVTLPHTFVLKAIKK